MGGDSAGRTLATVIAQECTRRGGPELRLQVLVYPATDLASDYASNRENAAGYLLAGDRIEWIRNQISQVSALDDPRFSPLHSRDLAGLPPALIVTAGYDPIRDETLGFAECLCAAGVPVQSLHYPWRGGRRARSHRIHARGRVRGPSFHERRDHLDEAGYEGSERHGFYRSLGQCWIEAVVASQRMGEQLQRRAGALLAQSWRS